MQQASATFKGEQTGPDAPVTESQQAATERPSWLPEKFKEPEALAKSYTEQESELGRLRAQIAELQKGKPQEQQPGQQQEQKKPDETSGDDLLKVNKDEKKDDTKPEPKTAEEWEAYSAEAAKAAGLDYAALEAEYAKDGKLSDASYQKFAKQGISRGMVDQHIAMHVELTQIRTDAALKEAGLGDGRYEKAVAWAKKGGFTAAESKAYDDAVLSGDLDRQKLALNFLGTKYETAQGKSPQLLTPDLGGVSGASGFYKSQAEMIRDMQDPRYAKDPAFRDMVEAKLANSPNLTV